MAIEGIRSRSSSMPDDIAILAEEGPRSPSRSRSGYAKIVSTLEDEMAHHGIGHNNDGCEDINNVDRLAVSSGLGIATGAIPLSLGSHPGPVQTIPARSVDAENYPSLTSTNCGDASQSPRDSVAHSAGFTVVDKDAGRSYYRSPNTASYRAISSVSSLPSPIQESDERRKSGDGGRSVKSAYDGTNQALQTKQPGLMWFEQLRRLRSMSCTQQLLSRERTLALCRPDNPFNLLDRLFGGLPIHRAQRAAIWAPDQRSQLLLVS